MTENKRQHRFLTLRQVQEMLSVSRSTLWRWHAERGLRVICVGGVTRIRESDLQEFLDSHSMTGGSRDEAQAQNVEAQSL